MKGMLRMGLVAVAALAASAPPRERTPWLLSTNDMHAKIQNFPRLRRPSRRAAIRPNWWCWSHAGDRWTGNAYRHGADARYADDALMNELGFDVATLGNHEFDHRAGVPGR